MNGNEVQVEKLRLDEIDTEMPRLAMIVRNAQAEIIAHVEAPIAALIVSPENRILYLEAACTSDSGAHALMGAVSDARGTAEFKFVRPDGSEVALIGPETALLGDARLAVAGWGRNVHHVVIMDKSGELFLAPDDETLWQKLRERMTCPTLTDWGKSLMPEIYRSGLLEACEMFGVPGRLKAYVLAANAQDTFDRIVGNQVAAGELRQ